MTRLRLRSAMIRGVRAIGPGGLHIQRFADVTILAGANGVGKTSIVGALSLALAGELWTRKQKLREKAIVHRGEGAQATSQASVMLKFTDAGREAFDVSWNYPQKAAQRNNAQLVALSHNDETDPSSIPDRFALTHLLPQGWGRRFQDFKLGERRQLLHKHLGIAELHAGLRRLHGNERVGRAAAHRQTQLSNAVERAKEGREEWQRARSTWDLSKDQQRPSDLRPIAEIEQDATALGRTLELEPAAPRTLLPRVALKLSEKLAALEKRREELTHAQVIARGWPSMVVAIQQAEAEQHSAQTALEKSIETGETALDALESDRARLERELQEAKRQQDLLEEKVRTANGVLESRRADSNELATLLSQLRRRFIAPQHDESMPCPVCQTAHKRTILLAQVDKQIAHLQGGHELKVLEQNLQTAEEAASAGQLAHNSARDAFARIDKSISGLRQQLQRARETDAGLPATRWERLMDDGDEWDISTTKMVTELTDHVMTRDEKAAAVKKLHERHERDTTDWRTAGFTDAPSAEPIEQEQKVREDAKADVEQRQAKQRALASELDRHNALENTNNQWLVLTDLARRLTDSEPTEPGEDTWLSEVGAEIEERVKRAEQELASFTRRWERLTRVRNEVEAALLSQDDELHRELNPLIESFLRALAPDLAQRVKVLSKKMGLEIEADQLVVDQILSEGEQSALSLAILLAMHVRFDWCRWRGLVLDDPFQSADVVSVAALLDIVAGLSQMHGSQIVLTTHDLELGAWCRRRMRHAGLSTQLYHVRHGPHGVEIATCE